LAAVIAIIARIRLGGDSRSRRKAQDAKPDSGRPPASAATAVPIAMAGSGMRRPAMNGTAMNRAAMRRVLDLLLGEGRGRHAGSRNADRKRRHRTDDRPFQRNAHFATPSISDGPKWRRLHRNVGRIFRAALPKVGDIHAASSENRCGAATFDKTHVNPAQLNYHSEYSFARTNLEDLIRDEFRWKFR
jgi:hypothetical protein